MPKKELIVDGITITYEIKSYRRSRSLRLIIQRDGSVLATKPSWVTNKIAEAFVIEKIPWILKSLESLPTSDSLPKPDAKEYKIYQERAKNLIRERLEHFNQLYGFTYKNVVVRNQRTCWGSCSAKGNLNFNYRLLFLPEELRDYVIVHELCHLRELNHSARFWALVAKTMPNYLELRRKLRAESKAIHLD